MKFPATVAAVVAKTAALEDLNPPLFGWILLTGGAMLISTGLRGDRDR
jgi:hypothetical protein